MPSLDNEQGRIAPRVILPIGKKKRTKSVPWGKMIRGGTKETSRVDCSLSKPFLPRLIPVLERDGHLRLDEENRHRLLTMSIRTAERLLIAQRRPVPHGFSTTKPGTLLKHQILIRTFEQWDDHRPGFLEADLVAHSGSKERSSGVDESRAALASSWSEPSIPTNMYASAQLPADGNRREAYGDVGKIPEALFATFNHLFQAAEAPKPHDIAEAIARIVAQPKGSRPARTVVGAPFGSDVLNEQTVPVQQKVLEDLGLGYLAKITSSEKTGEN